MLHTFKTIFRYFFCWKFKFAVLQKISKKTPFICGEHLHTEIFLEAKSGCFTHYKIFFSSVLPKISKKKHHLFVGSSCIWRFLLGTKCRCSPQTKIIFMCIFEIFGWFWVKKTVFFAIFRVIDNGPHLDHFLEQKSGFYLWGVAALRCAGWLSHSIICSIKMALHIKHSSFFFQKLKI